VIGVSYPRIGRSYPSSVHAHDPEVRGSDHRRPARLAFWRWLPSTLTGPRLRRAGVVSHRRCGLLQTRSRNRPIFRRTLGKSNPREAFPHHPTPGSQASRDATKFNGHRGRLLGETCRSDSTSPRGTSSELYEGCAFVGVTTQRVAVDGYRDGPRNGLTTWDPERYGDPFDPTDGRVLRTLHPGCPAGRP